jgi:DNA repair exonuclease SbcCD ATPase subunit
MNCLYCGQEVQGRKSRKFCNDAHKQAYWRKQHQPETTDVGTTLSKEREEARQRITELEQENTRLLNKLDVERRYHQDTTARGLKAWLKKQAPSPLGQKLLADTDLPIRGSRGLYEAHLRRLKYSQEEVSEFTHLWKAMLLS